MMLKGTKGNKKYIRDVMNTKVIYIYIFEVRVIQKHAGKDIGEHPQKRPNLFIDATRVDKKNIMNAKNKRKHFIL